MLWPSYRQVWAAMWGIAAIMGSWCSNMDFKQPAIPATAQKGCLLTKQEMEKVEGGTCNWHTASHERLWDDLSVSLTKLRSSNS